MAEQETYPAAVGPYKILGVLGRGAMGTVFKARHGESGKEVALKVLAARLASDRAYRERFQREARAVSLLRHPNIVEGIDVGETGGRPYLAMEYVPGKTTLQLLRARGRLPEAEAVSIGAESCKALQFAKRYGVIHRDIKPSNLLVAEGGAVKLLDLGLAKEQQLAEVEPSAADKDPEEAKGGGPGADETFVTRAGTQLGTPYYMSPEQIRGEAVDARSDLYALGATLWHLAIGRPPFVGATASAVLAQHLGEPPRFPPGDAARLSEGFRRILVRALQKSPDDRYGEPGDMLADLEALSRGETPKNAWQGPLEPEPATASAAAEAPLEAEASSQAEPKSAVLTSQAEATSAIVEPAALRPAAGAAPPKPAVEPASVPHPAGSGSHRAVRRHRGSRRGRAALLAARYSGGSGIGRAAGWLFAIGLLGGAAYFGVKRFPAVFGNPEPAAPEPGPVASGPVLPPPLPPSSLPPIHEDPPTEDGGRLLAAAEALERERPDDLAAILEAWDQAKEATAGADRAKAERGWKKASGAWRSRDRAAFEACAQEAMNLYRSERFADMWNRIDRFVGETHHPDWVRMLETRYRDPLRRQALDRFDKELREADESAGLRDPGARREAYERLRRFALPEKRDLLERRIASLGGASPPRPHSKLPPPGSVLPPPAVPPRSAPDWPALAGPDRGAYLPALAGFAVAASSEQYGKARAALGAVRFPAPAIRVRVEHDLTDLDALEAFRERVRAGARNLIGKDWRPERRPRGRVTGVSSDEISVQTAATSYFKIAFRDLTQKDVLYLASNASEGAGEAVRLRGEAAWHFYGGRTEEGLAALERARRAGAPLRAEHWVEVRAEAEAAFLVAEILQIAAGNRVSDAGKAREDFERLRSGYGSTAVFAAHAKAAAAALEALGPIGESGGRR